MKNSELIELKYFLPKLLLLSSTKPFSVVRTTKISTFRTSSAADVYLLPLSDTSSQSIQSIAIKKRNRNREPTRSFPLHPASHTSQQHCTRPKPVHRYFSTRSFIHASSSCVLCAAPLCLLTTSNTLHHIASVLSVSENFQFSLCAPGIVHVPP